MTTARIAASSEGSASRPARLLPEVLLTLAVLAALGNVIHRFVIDGKLPQPFIFDVNDTFMDWYNTAFWAHNAGAFTVWRTVYPPLSFVLLKVLGIPSCYRTSGVTGRDCDPVGIAAILIFYALCVFVAARVFRQYGPTTWPFRSIAFGLGLPLLFTLERGNLILPAFVAFALSHSTANRSPWVRSVLIGVTINFKPYLLLPVMALAFKREWRELERAGIATVVVYLLSYGIMGSGSIAEMVANTANWVSFTSGFLYEGIYYSTSFTPFLQFNTPAFPVRDVIPSATVDGFLFAIPVLVRSSQALALLVMTGAWLQPRALSVSRIATLIFAAYLVTQSPGGYAEVFLLFLLFLESWQGPGRIVALIAGYLLCIPYDVVLSNIVTITGNAWLSGRPVVAPFGVSVGIFLRPALVLILFWSLAIDSLGRIIAIHCVDRPTLDPHPDALRSETATL